jgi:hypothetical protein
MSWTDLLSIIRSLNTVFTATGICHCRYVDCLLADTQHISFYYKNMHGPLNVKFCFFPWHNNI